MSYHKKISTVRGVEVCYWRIAKLNPNFISNTTEVVLYGYADEEQKKAYLADPLDTRVIVLSTVNYLDRVIETRKEAYEEICSATRKDSVQVKKDGELVLDEDGKPTYEEVTVGRYKQEDGTDFYEAKEI